MDNNPFEYQLEQIELESKKNEVLFEKLDKLIHKVFAQNQDGAELLALWKESLIMTPTVTPNSTQFQAGIAEGNKEFIRNVYLTIQKMEGTPNV